MSVKQPTRLFFKDSGQPDNTLYRLALVLLRLLLLLHTCVQTSLHNMIPSLSAQPNVPVIQISAPTFSKSEAQDVKAPLCPPAHLRASDLADFAPTLAQKASI
eukprot:2469888-Pyramimonas_sp.AAC.1